MPRNIVICFFMVVIFIVAVSIAFFPLPSGNAQLRNLYGTTIYGTGSPGINSLGTAVSGVGSLSGFGSGSGSISGFNPYSSGSYYTPSFYSSIDSLIAPPGLLFALPAVSGFSQIASSRGVVRSGQQSLSGSSPQGISRQPVNPLLAAISPSVGTNGLYYSSPDYLSRSTGAVNLVSASNVSASSLSAFRPFTPFFTGSQILQQLLLQPYAAIHGGPGSLISWPRAEVVVPATSPVVPVNYTYTVVNVFPHDKGAFTEGLVYNGGFLYEGTGIPGLSEIRKVDLLTGTVLQSRDLPAPYFGEGITIYAGNLIELTWQHNIGFVYDKVTFDLLQTFTYPTEGWGLTHNGTNLIMSDGTATLHFLDPVTFAEVSSLDVYDQNGPVLWLNELEYIKGVIFANVWLTDRVVMISPTTGRVVGSINLAGLLSPADIVFPLDVLNGIAYDAKNDRLFVTGKWWPKLFEIDLVPLP
ncbi:MAG: glutaminyl-peptide cyclotransferase [bacterium]